MESLNSYNFVLFVLTQIILMFTVPSIISGIKYSKSDYLYITGITALSLILFNFIDSVTLIILTIFIIILYFSKIKWYSILLIMTSQIILYCANYMYIVIFTYIVKIVDSIFVIFPIFFVVYVTISILFSYIINRVLKKISSSYLILNKGFLIVISTILLLTFSLFFFYSQINSDEAKVIRQYSFIFIGITIFLSILTFVISQFLLKEMKYKRNQEEIETYYEYTLKIEAINNEMRKFRHDYVNILTTLSEYIREDDMTGLRDYFNKNIVPMKDNLQMNAIKLNGIENLKVREIKGLITAKILRAQEMSIPISIEIPDEVKRINLNMIDLSRSIGIILDNAIEASTEIDDPIIIIRVAFIESENSVTFIVMNKCADDIPRIHELFQESFSTKGEGRGLGLSTLKEIADNADNVLLDTIIENGFFIQKVEIINN
ncbi:TPA: GHKL domain-containing protein [Staphylococcus aureus]|nr:GHKL domain-containing protein [Staphylococcus aureus]